MSRSITCRVPRQDVADGGLVNGWLDFLGNNQRCKSSLSSHLIAPSPYKVVSYTVLLPVYVLSSEISLNNLN